MTMKTVEFQEVSFFFKEEKILDNFSLKIDKGEKVCFVGASGSGKSTVLNLVAGFLKPQKGKIFIDELEVNEKNIKTIRGFLGWLPQNTDLRLQTVSELFFMPFTLAKNKKLKPTKRKIGDIFAKLNLETSILDKKIAEISGGQLQRILLASVILTQKPLLLLDEPTSALDAANVSAVAKLLASLNSTVLIATHDKNLMAIANKVINLKN